MTAVILGPELDNYLRKIGEELKGKTQLEEPYVDKRTIVHAVRTQNKVILALQGRIHQMEEVEKGLQKNVNYLLQKVEYFEKYTKKVTEIEDLLSEKIPLLDKICTEVQKHDISINRLETKISEQITSLSSFKNETETALSKTDKDLNELQDAVDLMPETIMISSKQVEHNVDDETFDGINDTVKDENSTPQCLVDIIAQQKQRSTSQNKNIKMLETAFGEEKESQKRINGNVSSDVSSLLEWKEEQKSVDLVTMKNNQDSMKNEFHTLENVVRMKVDKADVDTKLDNQFNEIANHLQTALSSVEYDEADFKSITNALSNMCESLREKKADKSEVIKLRRDFIENQIDGHASEIPYGGSNLDNSDLRSILTNYSTNENIQKALETKADKDHVISRLSKAETAVQTLERVVHNLITKNKQDQLHKAELAIEKMTSLLGEESEKHVDDSNHNIKQDCRNEVDDESNKKSTCIKGQSLPLKERKDSFHSKRSVTKTQQQVDEKSKQMEQFPPSNIDTDPLRNANLDPDDETYIGHIVSDKVNNRKKVAHNSNSNNITRVPLTMRNYSLPALATTTTTTSRPGSKNGQPSSADEKGKNNDVVSNNMSQDFLRPEGISLRRKPIVVPKSEGKLYSGLRNHEKNPKIEEPDYHAPIIIRTNVS